MRPARSTVLLLALAGCVIAAGLVWLLLHREGPDNALSPPRTTAGAAPNPNPTVGSEERPPDRERYPATAAAAPAPAGPEGAASEPTVAPSESTPTDYALRSHLEDRLHELLDRPAKQPANRHGATQIADSGFNPKKKQLSEHALRELQTLIDGFDDRELELSRQSKRIRKAALYAALKNGQVETIELGPNPGTDDPARATAFVERSGRLTRAAIARLSEDLGQRGTDWYALQQRTFYPDAISRENIVWFRCSDCPELAPLRAARSALRTERNRAYFRFFRER
ncbi:MAG: hypothetical protein NXI31_25385 [bacterium]|nr:hypothetical protein [bacterium]